MNQQSVDQQQTKGSLDISHFESLSSCCLETVNIHSSINSMMVCQKCNKIIKCFDNKDAFSNYLRFCLSQGRKIEVSKPEKLWLVSFIRFNFHS